MNRLDGTLTAAEIRYLEQQRVARLATLDERGFPHLVPVCFALSGDSIYITIDEKPKRAGQGDLQRIKNVEARTKVGLLVDHYEEDWSNLSWLMIRGHAEVLRTGIEHDDAQTRLCSRYRQYQSMSLATLPVIAIRIDRVNRWGLVE